MHVIEELTTMFLINEVDGLKFKDDIVVNHQIHTIGLVELYIIPIHWQMFLALYFIAFLLQQVFEGCFVG